MNLYLISQTENQEYDTYDSAVVAAKTADEAQAMHPDGDGKPLGELNAYTWVDDPAKVKVRLRGLAHDGVKAGVICASFNAG